MGTALLIWPEAMVTCLNSGQDLMWCKSSLYPHSVAWWSAGKIVTLLISSPSCPKPLSCVAGNVVAPNAAPSLWPLTPTSPPAALAWGCCDAKAESCPSLWLPHSCTPLETWDCVVGRWWSPKSEEKKFTLSQKLKVLIFNVGMIGLGRNDPGVFPHDRGKLWMSHTKEQRWFLWEGWTDRWKGAISICALNGKKPQSSENPVCPWVTIKHVILPGKSQQGW